jgi:hypothetical protein
MNYFCQLLNVQRTAEPFRPESSISEAEVVIGKLKCYKSLGADQISAELIQAGGGNITS